MNEPTLQRNVLDLCRWLRVVTAHFRPAQTTNGWRTPVSGDGKGFPDLVLVGSRVLWRELKSDRGRLDADQLRWRDVLLAAGADWDVWRPADWVSGRIRAELEAIAKPQPVACPTCGGGV